MTANDRYIPDGMEMWYFVPTIANPAAPTTSEINAGKEITCSIAAVTGFGVKTNFVVGQDMCSRTDFKVAGRVSLDDSSLEFYKSTTTASPDGQVFALFPSNTTGFILRFHPKTGAKQTVATGADPEVWPVTVSSRTVTPPKPGQIATAMVEFATTAAPVLNATVA